MSLRQTPSSLGAWVRVFVAAFIALHIAQSAWLVVEFDGAYTEGRPAPSEFHALIAMDKEQTLIDVELEKATAFLIYTQTRNSSLDGDQSTSNQEIDTEDKDTNFLEISRDITLFCLVLMVVSELLVLLKNCHAVRLRASTWMFTLSCFVLIMPFAFFLDLDKGDGNYYSESSEGSFVHSETKSDMGLYWLGMSFEMEYSGYDLGLVAEDNHSAVIANIPEPDSKDAQSFIKFDSSFVAAIGKNINTLFILPLTWFFLPSMSKNDDKNEKLNLPQANCSESVLDEAITSDLQYSESE